jgi:hypothetical protein
MLLRTYAMIRSIAFPAKPEENLPFLEASPRARTSGASHDQLGLSENGRLGSADARTFGSILDDLRRGI